MVVYPCRCKADAFILCDEQAGRDPERTTIALNGRPAVSSYTGCRLWSELRERLKLRKQNEKQIVGREGERWFGSILPSAWSVQRPLDDFGTDAIVSIGTETNILPLEFGVQIKSSKNLRYVNGAVVVRRITTDMLEYWLAKLIPTLLVVYDYKRKTGYFDWVQSIAPDIQELSNSQTHLLHVGCEREFAENAWSIIHNEVAQFHESFANAIFANTEIVPVCSELSSALATLTLAETVDSAERDDFVRKATMIAWTYVLVARKLNTLVQVKGSDKEVSTTLLHFRDIYFGKCRSIIHDFDKHSEQDSNEGWIAMKKLDDCQATRNELNAMLSECLFRLLALA